MEIRQKAFDTIFFSYICKVLSVSWIETSRMHGGGKEKSMGYYIMWM